MSDLGVTLFAAFGLMLMLEGALPLIAPKVWKDAFRRLVELRDGQIRFFGLVAIGVGWLLLMIVL